MMRGRFPVSAAVLILCAALINPARATEADRTYIKGKLAFLYVANPNDPNSSAEEVDVQKVLDNTGTTQFYTASNLGKFRKLIKALCSGGPVQGAGDMDRLQTVAAETLRITDKAIGVYLINDNAAQITLAANISKYRISLSNGRAWPCARCYTENRDSCPWGGSMTLGAWHFNNSSQFSASNAILATFCHELMHTQDLSDARTYLFGLYAYGSDKKHFFSEAVPDMAMTYKEGIANFVQFWYDTAQATDATTWFINDDFIIVEKAAPPGSTSAQSELYSKLQSKGIQPVDPTTTNFIQHVKQDYAIYRIRSLPPDILILNEKIIALILYHQASRTSFNGVMAGIEQIGPSVHLSCTSAFANLIGALCQGALSPDVGDCSMLTSHPGPKPYLLPLALCDYFTSFSSRSDSQENFKSDFKGLFENLLLQADCWVDLYWSWRYAVKGAVNINALSQNDMRNIAEQALEMPCVQ